MTTSMVRFFFKTVIYAKISPKMVNLRDLAGNRVEEDLLVVCFLLYYFKISGGQNSSVGSVWARCPQCRGFDPPLGTFSVEGIFPLELTWVQTPFPQKLLRMRV